MNKSHQKHSLVWTIPCSLSMFSLLSFCLLAITGKSGEFVGAADIFCEANHFHSPVKQPINTLSSISLVLVGLWVARYSNNRNLSQDWRVSNVFTRSIHLQTVYASTLVWIGVGSAFYHASGTAWSGTWDVVAQIPYVSFVCIYSLTRLLQTCGRLSLGQVESTFWYLYVTTTVVVSIPRLIADIEYAAPIAGLIGAFLLLEIIRFCKTTMTSNHLTKQARRYLINALICIVSGYTILVLSTTDAIWCMAHSLLQGHALWHLLSAVSTLLVFMFIVTDVEVEMVVDKNDAESLFGE